MDMSKRVKSVIVSVVLIVVAMIMMPIAIDAAFTAENDTITDSFNGAVVAGGATDVVLTQDLTDDNVIYVSAITATGAGANPVANTYTAGTNTLNVTGLGVDTPQNLTVTYTYSVVDAYNGVESLLRLTPLLLVVGLIVVAIINGLWAFKRE